MMRVLVTRPREQAMATKGRLEKMGHDVTLEALITIEYLDAPLPDGLFDGIMLTSSLAVKKLDEHWSADRGQITLVATGESTRNAAVEAGFQNALSADGNALDAARLAKERFKEGSRLIYPCAEKTAHDMSAVLLEDNIVCDVWPIYKTRETDHFSDGVALAFSNAQIDAVLLYSPSTAMTFARCWDALKEPADPPRMICLSEKVAAVLPDSLSKNSSIADHPSETTLLGLI